MKHSPFAGAAASFAHLLGRRPSAKRAEEKDREEKGSKRAEEDEEEEKAEEDGDEEKAEEDDSDAKAEDPDDEDDEDKEAKKAKGGAGKTYAAGRSDERKRCAAIFASEHAAGLPHVAAQLAFTTSLSAADAIAVMAGVTVTAQQGKRGGLADRMASTSIPNVGADGGKQADASTPAGMAAKMTAVYDRLTGTKK